MSELSGRVRGVVNTPTASSASGRWSVRAVNKYVAAGVWPSLPVPGGDFEPIAYFTVPSGGLSQVLITDIPQTYDHLQLSFVVRETNRSDTNSDFAIQFNGDTSTSNYAMHAVTGNGSGSGAALSNTAYGAVAAYRGMSAQNSLANSFAAGVVDVFEYANTSKATTVQAIGGYDANGSGIVSFTSCVWVSTAAVTSMRLYSWYGGLLAQHSRFALYGLKGAA